MSLEADWESAKPDLSAEWDTAQPVDLQSFKQESRRQLTEALPVIGAVGGGVLGAAAGPAGSVALGSLLGTVAGTSIGTSAKQLKEQSEGKIGTVKEVLGEQVRNVSEQTLWDMAGGAIGAGISKVFNQAMPSPREGSDIAQTALRQKGGTLSGAQAVQSPTLDLAESFARAGAGGKGQFIGLDKRNADALQAIKSEILSKISKDPANDRVAGKLFQSAIGKGEAAHSVAASALYKTFDEKAGNILVDLATPVKLSDDVTTSARLLGIDLAEKVEKGLIGKSEAGGRLIDQLSKIGKTVTFSEAHQARSSLLALAREIRDAKGDTIALRNATLGARAIDQAMEASANKLSPDIASQYRQISQFYKTGKQAFNNDVVQTLLKEQPERVGENLFKSGNVSEIIQAKASLRSAARYDPSVKPAKVLNQLQSGYLNALLTSRSAVNIEGETTAQNLAKFLADAKTNRQFSVMFNSFERKMISDFGRTAFLTLRNKPSQFGILAPLLQAGAIGSVVVQGEVGPTEIGLLLSPYVLGKVLTNPSLVTALTKGLQASPGTVAATSAVAKIVNEWSKTFRESPN